MSDEQRRRDLLVLGFDAEVNEAEILAAYHRRRALYRSGNLATYSLLSGDERRKKLEELEGAVQRLTVTSSVTRPRVSKPQPQQPAPVHVPEPAPPSKAPVGPEPDRENSPGAYLRHHRSFRGLSLEDVTYETKIVRSRLEAIENEDVDLLPAKVYVRGFVITLAELLALPDPQGLAQTYVDLVLGDD